MANFGIQSPLSSLKTNKKVVKKKINPIKGQRVVDYLDIKSLNRYINDQGKILPRRITGVTAFQQRQVASAVKYARHLAFLPFVANDLN